MDRVYKNPVLSSEKSKKKIGFVGVRFIIV